MGVNQIWGGAKGDAKTGLGAGDIVAESRGHQPNNKQQQGQKQAPQRGDGLRASWRSSSLCEGKIAVAVLMTALVCRMGHYLQVGGLFPLMPGSVVAVVSCRCAR